jgi:hypothetical protein
MILQWWRFAPWQLRGLSPQNPDLFCTQLETSLPNLEPYTPVPVNLWSMLCTE